MDEPRRNDAFDRELGRALGARGGAAAAPHLDAELAAAWIDRQLDAAATRSIEAHLADCADCQALIATLARLTPETAGMGVAWWRRIRAGWLVPAVAAAAAGLVIWVVLPEQQRATTTPIVTLQSRDERAAPQPPDTNVERSAVPATPPAAPRAAQRTEAEVDARAKRERAQPSAAAGPAGASVENGPVAEPPPPAAPPPANFAPAALAPPAPAPPLERKEGVADNRDAAPQRADKATGVAGESATARQETSAETRRSLNESIAIAGARGGALASTRQIGALPAVAPDGAARWRQTGTRVEFAPRSDAGFVAASLPVGADALTAASAPGGTVCWMAGRAGVVVVTTDGVRFTRTTAPTPANLVAIAATDARTAVVTADDGRRFRTTDQGATWSGVP